MTFDEIDEYEKQHTAELIDKCKNYHCEAQFKEWSGRDLSDAFWYALSSYNKNPNAQDFKTMELAYYWACHADHGLAHAFYHAWKWCGFNFADEYEKWNK